MNRERTDYHCHLLPAMDDGAADIEESIAMARILSGFGFTSVHCTPHFIRGGFENPPDRVARIASLLQEVLDKEGFELRLVPAAEHYLDEFLPEILPQALPFSKNRFVLVEVPFRSGPEIFSGLLHIFSSSGLRPLIAHPERCRAFDPVVYDGGVCSGLFHLLHWGKRERPVPVSLIEELFLWGCRFQGNLGSFAGLYGEEVRQRGIQFLEKGIYSCFGSDAHRPDGLESILTAGYRSIAAVVGERAAADILKGAW